MWVADRKLKDRAFVRLADRRWLRKRLRADKRVATAYLRKEEFGQLWASRREGWARQFVTRGLKQFPWQRLRPFEKFAAPIKQQWEDLPAYCTPRNKVKLDFVEGLNHTTRVNQRRASGDRDEEYLRLKILTAFLSRKRRTIHPHESAVSRKERRGLRWLRAMVLVRSFAADSAPSVISRASVLSPS